MGKYTADDIRIGIIYELLESGDYPTGYKVRLLVRDEVLEFDTVKEVYDLKFSEKYFPYPCLGEINFDVTFDENGVITAMTEMNMYKEGCLLRTGMTVGTYAMFTRQIDETTPQINEILHIEDGYVVLHGYDRLMAEGKIEKSLHEGNVPELRDGMRFKLADDAVVYTWDWSSAAQPFARCTQEQARERRYVTHFSVGSVEDIAKNCYWINFYSTRGDEDCFDMVKVFLNEAPGWE